jgi:putative transposase
MKFQFIAQQHQQYPVTLMCRVLEVSVSGYYAWCKREPSKRQREDEELIQHIEQLFQDNRGVYGSPRIHAELHDLGKCCSRKRVARLRQKRGLCAQRKRRRVSTTNSNHDHPIAPNLLNRDFTASAPNTRWVTDMTAIETAEGELYLAAVVDISSRMAVGWAMGTMHNEQVITDALMMAVRRRRADAGLLHHSDRGSEYTRHGYRALLTRYGIEVSMSRKADCYDNALMESFFGTVKECVYRSTFASRSQARSALFEYLEAFYNRTRRHSSLGYVSPVIYEQRAKKKLKIGS